jgi:acetylornithine/N-succinyldiaminopimelate aminotransferase
MALMNTYGERTTTLVRGDGAYLWDSNGKRYLDALSGIAVCGLGYSHPAVTEAITRQAQTLLHTSNLYLVEPQIKLGEALTRVAGMDRVFFSNSGAEANEAAIKIARKYGQDRGIERPHMITAERSFHGRTMATLSATGNDKIKQGFAPLVEGFTHVAYNDLAAIEAAATASTVAVMVEPVQGEGGVHVPAPDYLPKLRALCDARGWLLILDEIQTGNGRTGRYFAYQHTDILPDVVTTAKGLGNGVPIGACLARGAAAEVLKPGNHGSTFGGNPLTCSAALAVVEALEDGVLMTRATELGERIRRGLEQQLKDWQTVKDIRGLGLMIGIELDQPCSQVVEAGKELGLLCNVTAGNTIRLLPPLILSNDQADEIIRTVALLVRNL